VKKKARELIMQIQFMAYLVGSIEAVDFYCKAFNAKSRNCFKHSDDDNFYAHAEIVINEKIVLAISEKSHYKNEFVNGNNMQFWLTFDNEKSLIGAYNILKDNAEIHWSLAPNEWCKNIADLTDKFGVRWLLNIP